MAARRAKEKFGMNAMTKNLEASLQQAVDMGPPPYGPWTLLLAVIALLALVVSLIALKVPRT